MLAGLAMRNVFRHRGRSAMTLAAIGFGVAALIVSGGFVHDLYRQLGESIIHSQSGHLQVAQPALFAQGSRSPEKHLIAKVDAVKASLAGIPGVRDVMARLSFAGLMSNGRAELPVVGEGIEPAKEASLMTSIVMIAGRGLAARDTSGALVGEGLAKELRLVPGDRVTIVAATIDGAMNSVDLDVVGVFRSYSRDYDAHAVKIPLQAAQELMGTADANTIVMLLADTSLTDAVSADAQAKMRPLGLAVKTWKELNDFYANTVQLYDRQFAVLNVIILFMVALGVGNAVNMAVFERFGEFGTMRAMGNRGGSIVRLIMSESLLLGLIGAGVGVALGLGLALAISATGIPMPPPPNSNSGYTARIELVPVVFVQAAAVALVATVLAALIPAMRARRISIVDALRQAI